MRKRSRILRLVDAAVTFLAVSRCTEVRVLCQDVDKHDGPVATDGNSQPVSEHRRKERKAEDTTGDGADSPQEHDYHSGRGHVGLAIDGVTQGILVGHLRPGDRNERSYT